MPQVRELVEQLGTVEALDRMAEPVAKTVSSVLQPKKAPKDLLSGTWLGHPLHPMLTDLPIGAWTSAMLLDLFGGEAGQEGADRLIGLGLAFALPTAAAGVSDWSDLLGADRRVGLVHALANVAAVGLYGLSLVNRRRGRRGAGLALSFAGAAVASAGGYLGGHLSYRRGVNVNRNAWDEPEGDWTEVLESSALGQEPEVVEVDDADVLLVRQGERLCAISDTCGHAGGPLHEGEIDDKGQVTCPWHGSVFRLDDGRVVHGPATGNQPRYEARVRDGKIELRRVPA